MAAEKSRVTAEEERDAAIKKAEKLAKAAETAEFESSDYRTQITYLKRQVQAMTALSNGYGLRHTEHDRMWDHVYRVAIVRDHPVDIL